MMTRPEAPNPAITPWDIIEAEPRAAAFDVAVEAPEVVALWRMPEGVVPSVNDAPHCDWSEGAASDTREGMFWLMTLYAALMQFVQVTLAGKLAEVLASLTRLVRLRVPTTFWTLVRVCVIQLVSPSLRQTTWRTVG